MKRQRVIGGLFVLGFAAIATGLIIMSQASTPTASVESENGTQQNTRTINDSSASGGKAVTFDVSPGSGAHSVPVTTAAQLTAALAAAQPGDVIELADGTYSGKFNATASGTSAAPIIIRGGRNAIINGGSLTSGYTFSLGTKNSASTVGYWRLDGFTVTGGQKGIIFDNVQRSIINNVLVHDIGEEGIHLRNNSSDNVVQNSTVTKTGQDTQAYGEGIYVGSAVSNWDTFSQGNPDHSNRNQLLNNTLSYTGAENMDIKEGTHTGIISGNNFNGNGMCFDTTADCNFADSWIDMKGEGWTVSNNSATYMHVTWKKGGQTNDGMQVHVISNTGSEGSGTNDAFINNSLSDVGGYGFNVQSSATGIVVKCNNSVANAGSGFANVACTP